MGSTVNVLSFMLDPVNANKKMAGGLNATRNFVERARRLGYDIEWYCVTPAQHRTSKYATPDYCDVVTIDDIEEGWKPRDSDKTIVYAGCWVPEISAWKTYEEAPSYIDDAVQRQMDILNSIENPKTMVNISHRLARAERNIWKTHPELVDPYDDLVTFGPGDEIIKLYDKIDGPLHNRLRPKVRYVQHNNMMSLDRPEWKAPNEKFLRQFYWQGRGDSTWKGWRNWIDFKNRAHDHGIDINVLLNGIPSTMGCLSQLAVSTKPTVLLPYIEWEKRDFKKIEFSEEIEDKTRIYGSYLRDAGLELIDQAGFAMYTTTLPASMRVWPEYVTLECIQQGTILSVPADYFDSNGVFPNGDPEELGLIPLPVVREEQSSIAKSKGPQVGGLFPSLMEQQRPVEFIPEEQEWGRFKELYLRISTDPEFYEAWRERAWDVHIGSVDWDGKVRMVIDGGSEI